jgi:hypothetical protein
VIARRVLTEDPAMDDSEWRERLKCALLAQGWTYPKYPELLGEAMKRVEADFDRAVPVMASVKAAPGRPAAKWKLLAATPRVDGQFTALTDVIAALKQRRRRRVA